VAALDAKAEGLESKTKDVNFTRINDGLTGLATEIGDGDRAPPKQYEEAFAVYAGNLQSALKGWQDLKVGDLAALNSALKTRGLAPLTVPGP
jgi:hypothetical protein